jgi:nucleotide-binding universal stress UspA family protein
MFETIVVGTDGSSPADKAVTAAAKIAADQPGDAELHVVMAYHPLTAQEVAETAQRLPEEFKDLLHAHYPAESVLERAMALAEAEGVHATPHEVDQDPTDALVNVAEKVGADLVVVGSRGEGLAKRVMHGSVSTKLLHHTPCSLLVVSE